MPALNPVSLLDRENPELKLSRSLRTSDSEPLHIYSLWTIITDDIQVARQKNQDITAHL
jgi:hypothetical protein